MDDGQSLAGRAGRYAATAIRLDSQGSKVAVTEYYPRACDDLLRLARIYGNNFHMVQVWTERATASQNRIKVLKAMRRNKFQLLAGVTLAFIAFHSSSSDTPS